MQSVSGCGIRRCLQSWTWLAGKCDRPVRPRQAAARSGPFEAGRSKRACARGVERRPGRSPRARRCVDRTSQKVDAMRCGWWKPHGDRGAGAACRPAPVSLMNRPRRSARTARAHRPASHYRSSHGEFS
ncbi:hypothetical protein LC55x_3551 [Lysobacter capsici]|nr:hypothetical protein LC55x_3551 [Lysobacter capsici]